MSRNTSPELFTLGIDNIDYDPNKFEIRDTLQVYLAEIKNIFTCERGVVIGAMDKGIDLESLVYDMDLSENDVNSRIISQIQKYCTLYSYYRTVVTTKFSKGTLRDICMIQVEINGTKMLNILLK